MPEALCLRNSVAENGAAEMWCGYGVAEASHTCGVWPAIKRGGVTSLDLNFVRLNTYIEAR